MITLSQLSAITGISRYRLRKYIDQEKLDAIVISNQYMITEDEAERFRDEVLRDPLLVRTLQHRHCTSNKENNTDVSNDE